MAIAVERLLQLRAFEPLRELRRYLVRNPASTPEEACQVLLTTDASFSAADHEAAIDLHALLSPALTFATFETDLRVAIIDIVVSMRPEWAKRVFLGRARFLTELEYVDSEVRRCFDLAGLFVPSPSDDVILWWDDLNHRMRSLFNYDNSLQGRAAESESLRLERERVKRLGIDADPKWQSIDDNTLGYDILSYRPGEKGFPQNLLIEVKSSRQNPPVAIISRNEVKKAEASKDRYIFHVWHVKEGKPAHLHIWTYEQIAEHIPCDRGGGEWKDVSIPLRAVSTTPSV